MRTLFAIMMTSVFQAATAAEFFVAPAGSDANAGTRDQPFLTLERARDAARSSRDSTVRLAPGTYRLSRTLALNLLVNSALTEEKGVIEENNRSVAQDPGVKGVGIPEFEPIPFELMQHAGVNP